MIGLAFVLALQVAAPGEVTAASTEQPVETAPTEAQVEEAPQPKGKRVCRTVVDPRTRDLSQRRQVCRFVEESKAD